MQSQYRQGDVLLDPVEAIPRNVIPVQRVDGRLVLAAGEDDAHAHAITDLSAELLRVAEKADELYLVVNSEAGARVSHEEHVSLVVPRGRYRVVRQREYARGDEELVED